MIDKQTLEQYYQLEHLSMLEIAKRLGVSEHTVAYWMQKHSINRRTWSEATYLKRNPNGDPFSIKKDLTEKDVLLLGLGLGIYWGEGTKASLDSVRLGNTDPHLINTFIQFLTDICGVRKDKIRFGLQVFTDIDPSVALQYWQTKLGFTQDNFHSTVIVSPSQSQGTYKRRCPHGVITLYVNNKKLRNWLISQLITLRNKPT